MRPQKVNEKDLLQGLMYVLQSKGYEGSSLNDLAASSGLQKASLYHRFPGGKQEIAVAVLDYVGEWVENNIYNLLIDERISPNKRLESVLQNIDELYGSGDKTCILRALLMDSGIEFLGKGIKEIMERWIDGFTVLGQDFGFDSEESKRKAIQVLVNIQGSLVVAKGLNTNKVFASTLNNIKNSYKEN